MRQPLRTPLSDLTPQKTRKFSTEFIAYFHQINNILRICENLCFPSFRHTGTRFLSGSEDERIKRHLKNHQNQGGAAPGMRQFGTGETRARTILIVLPVLMTRPAPGGIRKLQRHPGDGIITAKTAMGSRRFELLTSAV